MLRMTSPGCPIGSGMTAAGVARPTVPEITDGHSRVYRRDTVAIVPRWPLGSGQRSHWLVESASILVTF